MNRRTFIGILGLACLSSLLPGCLYTGSQGVGQPYPQGPPPHAPAHGYRRKNHQGLEMSYDANLGVYIITNYPMYYYWDDFYYRKNRNDWEYSKDMTKKWKKIKKHKLPKGLQKR